MLQDLGVFISLIDADGKEERRLKNFQTLSPELYPVHTTGRLKSLKLRTTNNLHVAQPKQVDGGTNFLNEFQRSFLTAA